MQILTRKQAKSLGLKTYATGEPCVNGHVAYRYTQSGACSSCVVAANIRETPRRAERNEQIAAAHTARQVALQNLVAIKLLAHDDDLPTLRDTVTMMGLMRFPALTAHDLQGKRGAMAGTDGVFEVLCAAEDVPFLRAVQDALRAPHRHDTSPSVNLLRMVADQVPRGEIV